jgi:peptidyl-prolyl cis-trans isomerase C
MKRMLICASLLCLSVILFFGCGGEDKPAVENKSNLAGRVDDWTVEKAFIDEVIAQLPDYQQQKYDTPSGRAELTDGLITEEIFHREAVKSGLADQADVKERLDDVRRRILIEAYYENYIKKAAVPTEEEIHDYYETHADQYTSLEVLRAQHIFAKSKEKIDDIKNRIVDGGEKFTEMAKMYSEDEVTKADGGNLGFFNPGGYIRSIGFSEVLNDTITTMETGTLYGPIKWEKGYSLVILNERRPAELKPYSEVKDEIVKVLTNEKIKDVKKAKVEELRKNYTVENYMEEYYLKVQRSPEELFTFAQNSDDPWARIEAFEEIVDKFPEDKYAPQALFMIGFVYLEELSDKVSAGRYFGRVLSQYPDSDVADSARWMLDNIDQPLPEFEDLKELNKKIQDESN